LRGTALESTRRGSGARARSRLFAGARCQNTQPRRSCHTCFKYA
jgi:hypothetical protein